MVVYIGNLLEADDVAKNVPRIWGSYFVVYVTCNPESEMMQLYAFTTSVKKRKRICIVVLVIEWPLSGGRKRM